MPEPSPPPASTQGYVIPMLAMTLLFAAMVRQAARPIRDDVWWHLVLGRQFLEGRSLSNPGPFGTFASEDWVPTQWLSQVIGAEVFEAARLPGVSWIFGFALITLIALLYLWLRQSVSPLSAAFTTGITTLGMSASLSPRPHMLTYLLLALTLLAWQRTAADLQPRWWLVPLTWLWANLHGMWFIGPLVGAVFVTTIHLDHRPGRNRLSRLLLVPLLSTVTAALTPVGPRLLGAPAAVSGIGDYITEWAPPDFTDQGPMVAALMAVAVVARWARDSKPASWSEIAVLVLGVGFIGLSARTVTLGAIILAPLFAGVIQSLLSHRIFIPLGVGERSLVVGAAAVCLAVLAAIVPHTSSRAANTPDTLLPALRQLPSGTVIISHDYLGGWLMLEVTEVTPVIDGLTESYSPEYLGRYLNAVGMVPGWQEFVKETGATAALLESSTPLSDGLASQLGWSPACHDEGLVLLTESSETLACSS